MIRLAFVLSGLAERLAGDSTSQEACWQVVEGQPIMGGKIALFDRSD